MVDYYRRKSEERYTGWYMDLQTEYGTLTGDHFEIFGPYGGVARLQPQVGGRLAPVPR